MKLPKILASMLAPLPSDYISEQKKIQRYQAHVEALKRRLDRRSDHHSDTYRQKISQARQQRIEARRLINEQILAALARGVQPKAICIDVNRSPAYVSRVGRKAGFCFHPGPTSMSHE